MVLDNIQNKDYYSNLCINIKKAFEYIEKNSLDEFLEGRYEIDNDNIFILIQSYTTSEEKLNKWESHMKYIDIQYILKGSEVIGWKSIKQLSINQAYSNERDITFYDEVANWTKLEMKQGDFAIFFPEDGHKPCCINEKPEIIKKAVIKIKVE